MKESESVANLTKPTLYSIYDKDVTNSEQDYKVLKQRFPTPDRNDLSPHRTHNIYQRLTYVMISFIILFWMGVVFAKLSTELYDNRSLKKWMLSYTLAKFTQWIQLKVAMSQYMIYGTLGILCGVSVPIVDKIFSSSHGSKQQDTDLKAILKCFNALFGVCLGIRTIQWSSSLQASTAWGLLNIILWLYFDGTVTILVMGMVVSGISVTITYLTMAMTDSIPWFYLLYTVDFYFLSYLLFGKIGRYLLQ